MSPEFEKFLMEKIDLVFKFIKWVIILFVFLFILGTCSMTLTMI